MSFIDLPVVAIIWGVGGVLAIPAIIFLSRCHIRDRTLRPQMKEIYTYTYVNVNAKQSPPGMPLTCGVCNTEFRGVPGSTKYWVFHPRCPACGHSPRPIPMDEWKKSQSKKSGGDPIRTSAECGVKECSSDHK